jgi:hydroxymethylbilane synthase
VQLAAMRPDLRFAELRGNMETRVRRAEEYDAVVVAACALDRLGWADQITERLDLERFVPQVGQGALAVECRTDDATLPALLADIEHPVSRRCVDAERSFLAELGGDCTLPAGAHAVVEGDAVVLHGVLHTGGALRSAHERGTDPLEVGRAVARALRNLVP